MNKSDSWQITLAKSHPNKRAKLKVITDFLMTQKKFNDCLDIGTGTGGLAQIYRTYGKNWTYVENDEVVLSEISNVLDPNEIVKDLREVADKKYDLITIIDCFYYFENPDEMISILQSHLKPEGKILITLTDGDKKRFINILRSILGIGKRARGFFYEDSTPDFINRFDGKKWKIIYCKTFSNVFSEIFLIIIDLGQKIASSFGKRKAEKNNENISFLTSRKKISNIKMLLIKIVLPFSYIFVLLDYPASFIARGYKFILVVKNNKN